MEEVVHLDHLLTGDDLRLRDIQRIGRIVLDHACGIEMQHTIHQRKEYQHVLARILYLPLRLEFLIHFLHVLTVCIELFNIHIPDAEAERHRLAKAVFPAQMERAASLHGKIRIACGINEITRFERKHARFRGAFDAGDGLTVLLNTCQESMVKGLYPFPGHEPVKGDLQVFFMDVLVPFSFIAADFLHDLPKLRKKAARKKEFLTVYLGGIRHERIDEASACRAS